MTKKKRLDWDLVVMCSIVGLLTACAIADLIIRLVETL